MIVRIENLDQSYGELRALSGVTFSIESGCTGLLGPNGAGKSTLMRSLLGQQPVLPGRLSVCGIDPATEPLRVRQVVGYMPEADAYLPGLNALEMVAFSGELSGMPRSDALARSHEVLHFVGLGEARYRDVEGYSTGMRQRAKLAAALVHGPQLLMLDEPTSGLDPSGREEMLKLIDDVAHHRGVDVVFSSHILADIERTSDHVVVLSEGRLVFAGTREAFQRTESRTLEVRVKEGRERLAQALSGHGCRVSETEGAAHLTVELPEGETPDLIWRLAAAEKLQVRHLAPATASLETAFERAVAAPPKG